MSLLKFAANSDHAIDGTLTDSTASGGAASSKSSSGDCDAIISEFGMAVYVFFEEGHHAEQRLLHQD